MTVANAIFHSQSGALICDNCVETLHFQLQGLRDHIRQNYAEETRH